MLAYGELSAFERLAADAALAPTVGDKAELAGMAVGRVPALRTAARTRCSTSAPIPRSRCTPSAPASTGSTTRRRPADWLEGLVKAYVGDGIGTDFYREVAAYLDPGTRDLVLEVCADTGHSDFAVDRVRAAIQADPRVAGRLALWGRRLVGEMLSQAQRVAADRDALVTLIVGGMTPAGQPAFDLAGLSRMFARLTENHTRRMQSMGLSA